MQSLRSATVLVVAALLWASAAHADDPTPPAPTEESRSEPPQAAVPTSTPDVHAPRLPSSVEPGTEPPPSPPPPPKPAPQPYSVPWQLRPIVAPTIVRSETSFASYEDRAGNGGMTIASILTAAYRIPGTGPATAGLSPVVRAAFVTDDPPPGNNTRGGATFVNPLVGAGYAIKLDGGFRLNAFLGATIPVGGGGGDAPFAGSLNSRVKGINARAQLDNALFAVNDFTVIPGFGAAYVNHGLTVQVEATLLHLMRVRGEAAQPEASKTNMTAGLHVGYFFLSELSVGSELRYQRWLNAPFAVEKDPTGATRDTLTFAVGPRVHIKLGDLRFRPGISYQRGLDRPLAASTPNYHIAQFDLPLFF